MCYMEEITHRQMRNESAVVLRRVEEGETILVTNSGRPAAVIGPPPADALSALVAQGQVRKATAPTSTLRDIRRRTAERSTSELLDDVRGRW